VTPTTGKNLKKFKSTNRLALLLGAAIEPYTPDAPSPPSVSGSRVVVFDAVAAVLLLAQLSPRGLDVAIDHAVHQSTGVGQNLIHDLAARIGA
jgi:hypothetical protein